MKDDQILEDCILEILSHFYNLFLFHEVEMVQNLCFLKPLFQVHPLTVGLPYQNWIFWVEIPGFGVGLVLAEEKGLLVLLMTLVDLERSL